MLSESSTSCREVVDAMVDQSTVVNLVYRQHLERCDDCRAEVALLRQLRDELRGIRADHIEVPTDLMAAISTRIDGENASPARRAARLVRVAPYVGGVVAATAAGALLAGRRRLRTI